MSMVHKSCFIQQPCLLQKHLKVTCNHLTCVCDVMIRGHSQQAELSEPPADLDIDQEATPAAAAAAVVDGEPPAGTVESGQLFMIAFICIENRS